MYSTELMQTSQIYLIMVIGIRKYQINADKEELLKTLSLLKICDDSINDTCVYRELLEAFICEFADEYIDYRLEGIDVESYHYDVLMHNFRVLREFESDDTSFLTTLEGQLQSFAYNGIYDEDEYDENVKIAINYMLSEKLLYSSIVFKHDGIILREKLVFLKPVIGTLETMRQNQLIL